MKILPLFAISIVALAYLVAASPAQARTWYITPDGTGDAPTIQAGIDSAVAGDIVELACGTYYEQWIQLKGGITLRSTSNNYECATIDGDGWGIFNATMVYPRSYIEGITLANGQSAISCNHIDSIVDITNCWIENMNNTAIHCDQGFFRFFNCVFVSNHSNGSASLAQNTWFGSTHFYNCTIVDNF